MSYLSRYGRLPRLTRGFLASFVALLVVFLVTVRSDASSIRLPMSEISARSPLVVRGRVERIESFWTPNHQIESTVYLRLTGVPRGALSTGALIPVRVSGGRIGNLTMESSEAPAFTVGEDTYLFLAGPDGAAYRVTADRQGKFDVLGDRAVNPSSRADLTLSELEAGVRGGGWPVERAPQAGTPEPNEILPPSPAPDAWDNGSSAAAAGPDSYVYNGQKWPGSRPMEKSYLININTGDAGGGNGSVDAFRNAIMAAANAWGSAGANFSFKYGGSSGITSSGQDSTNVVHWENMGNTPTLAETTWWYSGNQIVEADLRFNDYYTWDVTGAPSSNEVDLQSVAVHEFGHWLSLGHDTDSTCPRSSAVMCASYNLGTVKRALGPSDVAGIKAIYGSGPAPATNTPAPTYTPTRTPTPVPTLPPWKIKSRIRLPMISRR